MKAFYLISFLLIAGCSFGQSAFDIRYAKAVCNCLDSLKKTELSDISLSACFEKALDQNNDAMLQELKTLYGDSAKQKGYAYGKNLAERTAISLVKDCYTYFVLVDSLRYKDYAGLNQDSLSLALKKLDKTDPKLKTDEFYCKKAMLLFQLKKYDLSLSAIGQTLRLNPNNVKSMFLKAWIYQIKGNYDAAILLYDKVAELSQMNAFYIYSEVAKRKKRGN